MRAHALSVHRAVLLGHDHSDPGAWYRFSFDRSVRMARAWRPDRFRKQGHLVGNRTRVGKVLVTATEVRHADLLSALAEAVVERVAGAADGADRVGLLPAVEGLAQTADVNVDGALVDVD